VSFDTGRASYIKVSTVPLVKGTETQHILITGGTGSGKTNCLHHILPQIRKNRHRAVIVDTTGTFVARYFREGKDYLLNPFDTRSVTWNPWAECKSKADIEDLAECFIPCSYSEHEDYWRNASRALFSSLMQKMELTKKTSDLTRWILFESLSKLCNYIQGTKGAAHIDINSEKTAASIRSVASSFLSCLEFLNDTDEPFSIRDWLHNKNDESWLFLSCTTAERASIRPLLSCWFSIATRSLIQIAPDFDRRIWYIVDELPSLNKLKDLEVFLAEGRKYGGCALLALQSIAQLEAIYGRETAKIILGNCTTKIAFSEQDPETAGKISKSFGEREYKEYQEGLSYGAHEARDGVTLSLQTRSAPLISPTEIQSLKRNHAFLKLPENLPITKIKLKILN
jgi:type IV conjugative transfer system coupling protein TraD